MKVEIQLENSQVGETVIELFRNLTPEDKRELALSVLREWLQEPSNFETKNHEELLLDEYKSKKRELRWSRDVSKLTDMEIMRDDNFCNDLRNFKNSKQLMVQDIRNEIVSYYKEFISKEIQDENTVENLKKEMSKIVSEQFPYIINNVLINLFTNNMMMMQHDVRTMMNDRLYQQSLQNG